MDCSIFACKHPFWETARDRDRLRQQVLEARGWTIHRLWSTDWFKDRHGQIERLLELIERDRQRAREEQEAEKEVRERLAALGEENASQRETSPEAEASSASLYSMPLAQPYGFAELTPIYRGQDLSTAPASFITQAIIEVVAVEAPLHLADLVARVATRWDCVLSPRRTGRIRAVAEMCAREGQILLRGNFAYPAGPPREVMVRSRTGTRIPPERIPPEEYREAILMVLRAGDGLDRNAREWSLRDLSDLPNNYAKVYATLYSLQEPTPQADHRVRRAYESYPWKGGYSTVNFFRALESHLPEAAIPQIRSMQYAHRATSS